MDVTTTQNRNGGAVATCAGLAGGDLQKRIEDLPCNPDENNDLTWEGSKNGYAAFRAGHREARRDAAALAGYSDRRMRKLETALRECQVKFIAYASGHYAKGTDEGNAKGKANYDMAERCARALNTEPANNKL